MEINMDFIVHNFGKNKVIEISANSTVINSEQDALDIMANIDYRHGCRNVIISEKNIDENFFDLKTGLAGSVLQKFSNYQFRLVIVGDFNKYGSNSLKDFIFECNNGNHILFVNDMQTALEKLA